VENVKGLSTGNNKQILQQIVGILKDLGYTVEWKVLNTKDHGVPQSRPRLYIVAIRTRFLRSPISFPGTTKMIDLAQFLDTDDVRSTTDEPITKCFSEAITKAKDKFGQKTLDESFVIIDTAASEKYSTAMLGCVPFITKSRGRLGTLVQLEIIPCACSVALTLYAIKQVWRPLDLQVAASYNFA
jgi:site-specific DNA-cytosine methylase